MSRASCTECGSRKVRLNNQLVSERGHILLFIFQRSAFHLESDIVIDDSAKSSRFSMSLIVALLITTRTALCL